MSNRTVSHQTRNEQVWPRRVTYVLALGATAILAGCATVPTDVRTRCQRGYVYYLDGAGGGGPLTDWSGGIRDGLRDAGYPGWGEMFSWQTGLGVAADQVANNHYKRIKAAELARKILAFEREHPNTPITLIGHSAGTVVAVYTLEALPDRPIVENVVLLSGSLSANYDLTAALARVRQNVYLFTSDRDVILTALLPILGPANRGASTNRVLGASGLVIPAHPSQETQRQYAKVIEVRWNQSFSTFGNRGHHLDTVNARFVRAFIAPLVFVSPASEAGPCPRLGTIRNPDYQCWAPFAPGSWAVLEGTCACDGHTDPCRVKTTLISKTSDSAVIEHELTIAGRPEFPLRKRTIVLANVDPLDHPMTHAAASVTRIGQEKVLLRGTPTKCDVTRIAVPGTFDFWGNDIRAETYTASVVPGFLARLTLRTTLDGKQYDFVLQARDYLVALYPVHMTAEAVQAEHLETQFTRTSSRSLYGGPPDGQREHEAATRHSSPTNRCHTVDSRCASRRRWARWRNGTPNEVTRLYPTTCLSSSTVYPYICRTH
jgi:pimeloyl-ACP methyl ester carboxylesterase